MRPSGNRLEIALLSVTMSLLGPLSQRKHFTAHRLKRRFVIYKHNRSAIFFFIICLEAAVYFSLDNFSISCLWTNWFCANKWRFFHSLPKQMLPLDKIFTTESRTIFAHRRCYSQHKMKDPLTGCNFVVCLLFFVCFVFVFVRAKQNIKVYTDKLQMCCI